MSDIRWEDPPQPRGQGVAGIWIDRLRPLMEHPKRWAIVAEKRHTATARVLARDLRTGRFKMPPGRWEFAARTADGMSCVYARYLGPDEDGAS